MNLLNLGCVAHVSLIVTVPKLPVLLQVLPAPFQIAQHLPPSTEQRAVRTIELYHTNL